MTIGFGHFIRSDVFQETRYLRIGLPDGYDPARQNDYALLVLSDGPWDFPVAATLTRSLAVVGAIPPMVVIGVSNPNRNRDLIPFEVDGIAQSGGGRKYLASLADEVIPYVDANWPTNGFRVFSGHSLGGLTALNIFVEKPDLFDAYIALSPSMEVGEGLMLERCREFLRGRDTLDKMLFLAVGDEHAERLYFDRLVEFLPIDTPQGFRWGSGLFDQTDDHNSMRVTGVMAGLRWVFHDWRLSSHRICGMTFEQIETHYIEASRRFKQPRELTVHELTGAAYFGLHDSTKLPRSIELARMAIDKWPDQAAPYAALGTCLEASGKLEGALKAMEAATRLALAAGDDHFGDYRRSLDRIKAKIAG